MSTAQRTAAPRDYVLRALIGQRMQFVRHIHRDSIGLTGDIRQARRFTAATATAQAAVLRSTYPWINHLDVEAAPSSPAPVLAATPAAPISAPANAAQEA